MSAGASPLTNHARGLCPCHCTCGEACDHRTCPCVDCVYAREHNGAERPGAMERLLEEQRAIVTCACGRSYTRAEWDGLPSDGTWDDGEGGTLDLRRCVCGSTRAIKIDAAPATRPGGT